MSSRGPIIGSIEDRSSVEARVLAAIEADRNTVSWSDRRKLSRVREVADDIQRIQARRLRLPDAVAAGIRSPRDLKHVAPQAAAA